MTNSVRGDQSRGEEPRTWIGGEASLDPRMARYVRRRESRSHGFSMIAVGVTFAAGLALGVLMGTLWGRR